MSDRENYDERFVADRNADPDPVDLTDEANGRFAYCRDGITIEWNE